MGIFGNSESKPPEAPSLPARPAGPAHRTHHDPHHEGDRRRDRRPRHGHGPVALPPANARTAIDLIWGSFESSSLRTASTDFSPVAASARM